MWGISSYFGTKIPTPNEQPFLPVVMFPLYFVHIYHSLHFLIYFCTVIIRVVPFPIKLSLSSIYLCKVSTSRNYFTTLYPLCYFIKQSPYFVHCALMFFNTIYFLVLHHFLFLSLFFHIQFS